MYENRITIMVEWWDEIGQCIICLKTMNINKNGWCDATVFCVWNCNILFSMNA